MTMVTLACLLARLRGAMRILARLNPADRASGGQTRYSEHPRIIPADVLTVTSVSADAAARTVRLTAPERTSPCPSR